MWEVQAKNVEDYEAFLAFMFHNGYTFSSETTVEGVNDNFGRFEYPYSVVRPDKKSIGGNFDFRHKSDRYTLPEDFSKVIDRVYNEEKYIIVINHVGEYNAVVSKSHIQVGCQTISHEKFRELQEAVNKIKQ